MFFLQILSFAQRNTNIHPIEKYHLFERKKMLQIIQYVICNSLQIYCLWSKIYERNNVLLCQVLLGANGKTGSEMADVLGEQSCCYHFHKFSCHKYTSLYRTLYLCLQNNLCLSYFFFSSVNSSLCSRNSCNIRSVLFIQCE